MLGHPVPPDSKKTEQCQFLKNYASDIIGLGINRKGIYSSQLSVKIILIEYQT